MRLITALAVIAVTLPFGAAGWAQEAQSIEEVVEGAAEACQEEINSYCSQVTPGEDRLLACFYAHQDKLSGRCEYALYEASAKLEQFAAAITYLANECADDIGKFCGDVKMGEGRIGMCLLDHEKEVSQGCRTAMEDGGLVVIEE